MLCKICKTQTNKTTTLSNGKIFHHCDHCGFSFLDDQFHVDQEAEKARYDQHENSLEDKGYVKIFEDFIASSVTPFVKSPAQILDYGSGPQPVLAELLKNKGFEVDIYDPFYAPNKPSKQYDLITSTEVFEHFNNPVAEIEKVVSHLKPQAILAIMTRFSPSLEDFKSWFYKDDSTHVSFFDLKTFSYLEKAYNFRTIHTDQFNTICLQLN